MSARLIPPSSKWDFPDPTRADRNGVVCLGADLEPGTILAAYRQGMFPMPIGGRRLRRLAWWSPDPRGVLPLNGLKVSRSLRRSQRRYEIRVDTAFPDVIDSCADPTRSGAWISSSMRDAYVSLHELGWAHSVEAFDPTSGALVGGLYGLAIGGLFAGESMFSHATDASKVALVHLVDLLTADDDADRRLLDVQWRTDHLATLGVVDIARDDYLARLRTALTLPAPPRLRMPSRA